MRDIVLRQIQISLIEDVRQSADGQQDTGINTTEKDGLLGIVRSSQKHERGQPDDPLRERKAKG